MNEFHYNSQRAQESRVGKVFEPVAIRALMIIAAIVLVALGAYLMLILHSAIAWMCWGLAIAIFVIFIYVKYELLKPPLGPSDDINDLPVGTKVGLFFVRTLRNYAEILEYSSRSITRRYYSNFCKSPRSTTGNWLGNYFRWRFGSSHD